MLTFELWAISKVLFHLIWSK